MKSKKQLPTKERGKNDLRRTTVHPDVFGTHCCVAFHKRLLRNFLDVHEFSPQQAFPRDPDLKNVGVLGRLGSRLRSGHAWGYGRIPLARPVMRYLSVCSGIEAASVAWEPLGNSMAVPVVRWIGERLAAVDRLTGSGEAARA